MVIEIFIVFWILLFVVDCYKFNFPFSFGIKSLVPSVGKLLVRPEPVSQLGKEPVLVVTDPLSNCKVHLVGVSHGSIASSELVRRTLNSVKPKAVVVELCEDRFLSISLDSQIRPRNNQTLINIFDSISQKRIERKVANKNNSPTAEPTRPAVFLSNAMATYKFAKSQGFIGGVFVTLGLFVSSLQKVAQSSTADEFIVAMKVAETLQIPVLLGDAPQNDTLRSIRSVVSKETFTPSEIIKGAKFLGFSSLGISPLNSNKPLSDHIKSLSETVMADSKWISIPKVYADNPDLFKSLFPILAIALFSVLSSSIITPGDIVSEAVAPLSLLPITFSLSGQPGDEVFQLFDGLINVFAVLLLIRMAKLIGTDRDSIIASKVQEACRLYPNKEVVVVIGMLHCNGVARWLLSGLDPIQYTIDTEKSL